MRVPKKKVEELYNVVHTEIVDARIKIAKLMKIHSRPDIHAEIDNILFELNISAPEKAIDIFKKQGSVTTV